MSRDLDADERASLRRLYVLTAGSAAPASLAGYTAVATALLNLDSALTR
jgi:hypothetical protein